MINYYHVLGLKEDASALDIKSAYRKLATKFHPDKNDGDSFFEKRFLEIKVAYDTLSKPTEKTIYDRDLKSYYFRAKQNNNYRDKPDSRDTNSPNTSTKEGWANKFWKEPKRHKKQYSEETSFKARGRKRYENTRNTPSLGKIILYIFIFVSLIILFVESLDKNDSQVKRSETRGKSLGDEKYLNGSYYSLTELNVREGPGTSFRILKRIQRGEKINIVSSEGIWAIGRFVTSGTSFLGYLHSDYISLTNPESIIMKFEVPFKVADYFPNGWKQIDKSYFTDKELDNIKYCLSIINVQLPDNPYKAFGDFNQDGKTDAVSIITNGSSSQLVAVLSSKNGYYLEYLRRWESLIPDSFTFTPSNSNRIRLLFCEASEVEYYWDSGLSIFQDKVISD